jgi:DNA polymerase III subunit gamma/tau
MVFYRKYRPQKIEDLDNEKTRETLYTIFANDNYPHAFLFSGPKGLGKTSAARIIAKVVNCENRKVSSSTNPHKATIEPCNKCDQCKSITSGTNIDVLEIDGASNRGIDEIRDLREKIKLSPARATKKVYIIDEVHMLTTEAFNALLKTLEEPPNHALFILCTTEPHKVLQTIASRCFQIHFKKATRDELIRSFERIIALEKIKIEKEALELIANFSDGSFRDGVKLLEEIFTLSKGEKITKEDVERKHDIKNINEDVLGLIKCFEEKDIKKGLRIISGICEGGGDLRFFAQRVIEKLHQALLSKVGVGEISDEINLSTEELKNLIEIFNKAYLEAKYSVLTQLPFEIALVDWCELIEASPLVEEKNQPILEGQLTNKAPNQEVKIEQKEQEDKKAVVKQPKLIGKKEAFWNEIIEKMKEHNHTIAGVLRGAFLQSMDNNEVIIETSFKFHKEKLTEDKTLRALQDVCSRVAGKQMSVSVILKSPSVKTTEGQGNRV